MKKIVLLCSVLVLLGISYEIQAQEIFRKNTLFAEGLGSGGLMSLNFDRRFSDNPQGFGIRAGLGYFQWSSDRFLSIPLLANWLVGNNGKYLEVGAGLSLAYVETFQHNPNMEVSLEEFEPSSRFGLMQAPLLNIGYRRQPIDGGFNFRVGLSPYVGLGGRSGISVIPWPYMSFGLSF
ncbi:hypothetical protein A33Q_2877 [Indibacter alkaliphilus LW1]|uniref:Outer membrane protein beta-barrel domain-containing protein n=1 Tax=Indibacter alkaliphilus (strain CCUG 57479 / KCTC 22604 / LW1) TaxID=1189612 RepID=S2DET3_INDAL|nr:hypothetical protein [Indibacter alkaliphilus]EOZ95515.1 hypothetical protein A33Q_2877 [Indibacter alkaliphilus LW1]